MKRRRRTELIIEYGTDDALKFAQQLLDKYEIDIIVSPRLGLTMIKQRETAKNTLFYSGEVLISECKVRMDDAIGLGIVVGAQLELAQALAVIDLAYQLELSEIEELNQWLEKLKTREAEEIKAASIKYSRTKVDFSTMNVD